MFWNIFKRRKEIVDMDFKFLESMQRLEIKNGDILVLRHPGILPFGAYEKLKAMFQKTIKDFGYDVKALILEEGMEIGALRKEPNK